MFAIQKNHPSSYNKQILNPRNILKILIVDDEIDVLNTVALLLESADSRYEITQVNNGKEAIEHIKLHQNVLDIIISDINMDEINGAQLARIVSELNPDIRIILMSGFISIIDQVEHFQLGIEKILTKPFEIDELVSIIENPTEKTNLPITSMIPVKVDFLVDASKIPVDLYVKLASGKFLKMYHAKQKVDIARLKQFLSQNVFFLYAKQDEGLNLDMNSYVPARVSNFKTSRVLSFNVFYFQSDEYKKLIPSGSMLNNEMLKLIKDHHIKVLYILDKDQPLFLNYLDEILDEYMQNKNITTEDKFLSCAQLMQVRAQETYINPTSENIVSLKKSQKHFIDFLKDNNNSIKDLLKMNENDKGIHIHCSMVASLSYAVLLEIMAMRKDEVEKLTIRALDEYIFESDDVKEIIFTGALLHDVGKTILHISNAITENVDKKSELFKLNLSHPQVAFDKLSALNVLHPKSLEIIIQHEEFCDGSGFPHKLKKTNISFFSQVVILVNYFDKLKCNNKLTNEQAIVEINKIPEKFNRHLIPILGRVVSDENNVKIKKAS
jgi:response regulator RpfG family c-di-GMP phosphodiesterase